MSHCVLREHVRDTTTIGAITTGQGPPTRQSRHVSPCGQYKKNMAGLCPFDPTELLLLRIVKSTVSQHSNVRQTSRLLTLGQTSGVVG